MNTLTKLPRETFTQLQYWVQVSFELVTQRSIRPTIVARRSQTKARKEIESWDAHLIVWATNIKWYIPVLLLLFSVSSVIFFLLVVAFLTSWSNYRRLSSGRICELKGKGANECGKGLAKNGIFLGVRLKGVFVCRYPSMRSNVVRVEERVTTLPFSKTAIWRPMRITKRYSNCNPYRLIF